MDNQPNPNRSHRYDMLEHQARRIHNMAKDRAAACKNWMATSVESGDLVKAQEHCNELREYEAIAASFNVWAQLEIADHCRKPVETEHTVRIAEKRGGGQ